MVVDDHPIVRHGVAALLDDERDIDVVAQAGTGEEAVALFAAVRPDVTVMDLRLPGVGGVEAIRRIRALEPGARVVVLTTYDGDEDIHRALEAGAGAYVLKEAVCHEIVETVRAVRAGRRRLPEAVRRRLAERPAGAGLTDRELDVLRLMAQGRSNKEIGLDLGIVEGTVKIHVARILDKLGVDDRTAAAVTALARGIIHP
jgi:two-component system NarL family response regulator